MTLPRPDDWITQKTLRSTAIMSIRPEMILPSRRSTRTASSRESLDQSGTGATGSRVAWRAGAGRRRMFLVQGVEGEVGSIMFIK
jgi:hypothetical protein